MIHTETQGSGPEVVLMHGWAANAQYMKPLADHLAKNFTVTNVDLPGRAGSDWSGIETMDDIVDRVLTAMPDAAIYIGWSFGGLVSASIAARFPKRVKRFVGVATTPKFIEDDSWPGLPKPGFQAGFTMSSNEEFKAAMNAVYQDEFEPMPSKKSEYEQLLKLNEALDLDYTTCLDGIKIIDAIDFRPQYRQITCPMDLILGESDPYVAPESHPLIQKLNTDINIHVIPGAKHTLLWTHADEFNKVLDAVLSS